MKILVTICARGGSKGVKNKNIRLLAGKPLIQHTIDVVKRWGKATRIVCSTDSEKIAQYCKSQGVDTPFIRPEHLSNDVAGKVPVIRHAYNFCVNTYSENYDLVIDLDVTNPLRKVLDLDNCLQIYKEKNPDILLSVVESRKNPYFNVVEEKEDGFVSLSKEPNNSILSRQEAPNVFDLNTSIYFYNPSFLQNSQKRSVFDTEKVAHYVMDSISFIDVDTEEDLFYMEFLFERGLFKHD